MDDLDEISHLMSLHAQQQMPSLRALDTGHVIAYDATANAVQVVFPGLPVVDPISAEPTGAYSTSPWVPLASPWVGSGWGFQAAPQVGDAAPPFSGTQCIVFIDPNSDIGLSGLLLYTSAELAPDPTLVAGEAIFKHASGTSIKFNQSGELVILAQAGLPITLPGGQVLSVNGTADALALVSKLVDAFNAHVHASTGAPPTMQWTPSTVESALVKVGS